MLLQQTIYHILICSVRGPYMSSGATSGGLHLPVHEPAVSHPVAHRRQRRGSAGAPSGRPRTLAEMCYVEPRLLLTPLYSKLFKGSTSTKSQKHMKAMKLCKDFRESSGTGSPPAAVRAWSPSSWLFLMLTEIVWMQK